MKVVRYLTIATLAAAAAWTNAVYAQESLRGLQRRIQGAAASTSDDEWEQRHAEMLEPTATAGFPAGSKKAKLMDEWEKTRVAKMRSTGKRNPNLMEVLKKSKGKYAPPIKKLAVGEVGILCEKDSEYRLAPLKIIQILAEDEMLVDHDGVKLWIKHVQAAGKAPGKYTKIAFPIEITGTQNYRTVIGAPAVALIVEPYIVEPKTK